MNLPDFPDVVSYDSGILRPSLVQDLFSGAKAIVFPSHYEGFGFPVLRALGNKKVVFVRDLPVYAEIKERVAVPQNIRMFRATDELTRLLIPENFNWNNARRITGDVGWDRAARDLDAILVEALNAATAEKIERRLQQVDLIEQALSGSQHRVQQLEEQITGFQNSTSWRVTVPLRKIKMWFS